MSAELIVYVEHKTDNGWENVNIYDKDGEDVTWRMFDNVAIDALFDSDDSIVYRRGLPENISDKMEEDWREYESLCTYFDWCELKALSRTPEAVLTDWDGNEYSKYNALDGLVRSINLLLECNGIYCSKPYEVRVICCLSI